MATIPYDAMQRIVDACGIIRDRDDAIEACKGSFLAGRKHGSELLAALKLARAYLDVSLGSPTWMGENPYPIIDAAIAAAEGRALTTAEAEA